MKRQEFCQYCGAYIDLGQAFLFEVEAYEFEQAVAPMELVRSLPYHVRGEPLPICKDCRESIEENRRDLLEEATRQRTRKRALVWFFATIAIGLSLFLLFCLIADLVGW
jgi:hypothetical protein